MRSLRFDKPSDLDVTSSEAGFRPGRFGGENAVKGFDRSEFHDRLAKAFDVMKDWQGRLADKMQSPADTRL